MSNAVSLHGFGGASMQAKVIACPNFASLTVAPKKHTIALLTEDYSGQYEFSSVAPNTASPGKAWIQLAASSAHGFSLTKKNPIWVYPVKCFIYNSGWKEVESYSYLNGAWISFGMAYLYDTGDEKDTFTGGWTIGNPPYSGSEWYSGGLSRGETHLTVNLNPDLLGSTANIGETLRCKNLIDLTPYKTLTFEGGFTKFSSNSHAWFACWTSLGSTYQQNIAAVKKVTATSHEDVVLDVSSLKGNHVVGVGVRACALQIDRCFLKD